ncbi:type I DNA topoisomerase, partial [bacterium]|nr:type I DNA topoisomerase [bacterium]
HNKVDAQVARRVVDRLVGYKVSPFIWKTVAKGLSAGRVQSVALRMICDRETEVRAFIPEEYWSIHGLFSGEKLTPFEAELVKYKDKKIHLGDEAAAREAAKHVRHSHHKVASVDKSEQRTKPYAPYTTSTLQQDTARKLRLSGKRTMALAQKLYEGIELPDGEVTGLITYMRTDSVRTASEALNVARNYIKSDIGGKYLPEKARYYRKKGRTQDAHEAIRPTDVRRTPASLKDVLEESQWKLYDLIWSRFVASQMEDSVSEVTTIEVEGDQTLFGARGHVRLFDGFQKVYPLDSDNNAKLPPLPVGFGPGFPLALENVETKQHFTQPPARYTEASLVKALDELGIGRPSTYATIIGVLFDRTYIKRDRRKLLPTDLGETVAKILVELFPDIFDVGFTARMEEQLDNVEDGTSWITVIKEFYGPFENSLEVAESKRSDIKKKVQEVTDKNCEKCGRPMVLKWGRRGRFLACSGFPECKNSQPLEAPQETGLMCPDCDGGKLVIKQGKFGRFLGCSNYPKCKHVEPIKTGVSCPKPDCAGELVERSSKKGRFWGCSAYPKCTYRSAQQPVPVECDQCGYPYMVSPRSPQDEGQLICPKCKHTAAVKTDAEVTTVASGEDA